jgi:hypothetical protein
MHTQFQLLHRVITRSLVVFLAVFAVSFVCGVSSVSAAAVSPSVIEIDGSRGSVVSSLITIINKDAMEQVYYLSTLKFTAKDEGGSPQFISKDEDHQGLPEWIAFNSTAVTVPAQSSGEVPFNIYIPSDALSGGHYAAITISSAPEDIIATNGAIIDAKTAVLVLLSVEGETNESAALLDFDDDVSAMRGLLGGEFEYRIQNQGNVHVNPKGEIVFNDFFGRRLLSVDANEGEGRVLPGSTRTYSVNVQSQAEGWFETISEQMRVFAIGPVSVELELVYGADSASLRDRLTIILFPWQLLISLLILLAIVWVSHRSGRKRHSS